MQSKFKLRNIPLYKKQFKISIVFILSAFLLNFAENSRGQSFLFPGIQVSTESGLSQTNTRGAPATLYNPANIIFAPIRTSKAPSRKKKSTLGLESYADFSLLSVSYTYSRPDYSPANVSATAPPITLGLTYRPQEKFSLGIIFVPRPALQAQQIKKLPFEQGAQVTVVNAEQKVGSVITGVGISVKPNKKLSLGFSIVETAEDGAFSAIPVEDSGSVPLLQMSYKGSFYQFIAGSIYAIDSITTIGGSFKTSAVKKYTGDVSYSGGTLEATTKQGYLPSVFALGMERVMGDPVFFGEYRREGWAAGGKTTRAGTPGGGDSRAYKDTNILIVGSRYKFSPKQTASGSIGLYPANVSYGSSKDENSNGGDVKSGVEFGDFDNLDRYIFSGSYKHLMKKGYMMTGFNYQTGSRNVPSSYVGSGAYKMSIFTLAIGGTFGF